MKMVYALLSTADIINPILEGIVPHPNKSTRSFRRTFKVMMRDLGVEEEVHDNITGHKTTICQ